MNYFKHTFATLFSFIFMTSYTTTGLQKSPFKHITPSNSIEVMSEKEITLNGQHHRALSLLEYKRIYQQPEKKIQVAAEDPCTSNFEDDPNSQYYFNKGIKFEVSKNKVLVDEFKFTHSNFLNFKKYRFTSKTTLDLISKIFPNAFAKIKPVETVENGFLQCMTLEETSNQTSDGKVLLFFKNNQLYMIQWWFPC